MSYGVNSIQNHKKLRLDKRAISENWYARLRLKWSYLFGLFCGLAKVHLVSVHAAFRVSDLPKYAMSGVRDKKSFSTASWPILA